MTFDEWFAKISKDWLKDAFNAGFDEGVKSEKAKTKPIFPPPYTTTPFPRDPFKQIHEPTWPGVKSCSKCGLSLEGVMGYVCGDMKCPTFKHTWSGTITSGGSSSAGAMGNIGGVKNINSVGAIGSGYSEGVGMGEGYK